MISSDFMSYVKRKHHELLCVFYSPPSSYLLPVLLLISKGVVEVFVHDGQVTGHHSAGAALDKVECLLLARGVHVIEEDPSYTPSLSPVPDVEVSVAPRHQKNRKGKSFGFHVRLEMGILPRYISY